MRSTLELCNLALANLGQPPISAIGDNSKESQTFRQVYDPILDEVLREFDWPFARVTAALVASASTVTGWSYVFTKPSAALAIRSVFSDASVAKPAAIDFEVSGSLLASSGATSYVTYTKRVTDPAEWDPAFVTALSYRLAEAMGPGISADEATVNRCAIKYRERLSEAKRMNTGKRTPKDRTSTYVDVR